MAKLTSTCLFVLVFAVGALTNAKNKESNTSFSRFDEVFDSTLTAKQIREQLEIRGDVYILDPTGKKVLHRHQNGVYGNLDAEE